MSPVKVHVGNLPDDCKPDSLRDLFSPYGEIKDLYVIKNFAFVQFISEDDARNSVRDLDKSKLLGNEITVEIAKNQRSKEERRREDGGGYDRRDYHRRDGGRDSYRNNNMGPPLGGGFPSLGGLGGGLLGAGPAVEQNILGNLGILGTLAAAAEQQKNKQEQQSEPRRDGAGDFSNGFVIYERYYVDPTHPLLKGLPVPELPRVTDSFAAPRGVTDTFVTPRAPPPRSDTRGNGFNEFRDRSPIRQQNDFPRGDYGGNY